jgi:hypothetical protein
MNSRTCNVAPLIVASPYLLQLHIKKLYEYYLLLFVVEFL